MAPHAGPPPVSTASGKTGVSVSTAGSDSAITASRSWQGVSGAVNAEPNIPVEAKGAIEEGGRLGPMLSEQVELSFGEGRHVGHVQADEQWRLAPTGADHGGRRLRVVGHVGFAERQGIAAPADRPSHHHSSSTVAAHPGSARTAKPRLDNGPMDTTKIPIDVQAIGCDLLSLSGHKFHAPQGTGVLYVRKGTKLEPLFFGGTHERQRRAGTENVAGIVGLGKAAEIAVQSLTNGTLDYLRGLRDQLESGILAKVEGSGVNGAVLPRVPNTTNLYFNNLEGEALVIALDLKGIAVSGGSACASGAAEPSHVLTAMGLRSRARPRQPALQPDQAEYGSRMWTKR